VAGTTKSPQTKNEKFLFSIDLKISRQTKPCRALKESRGGAAIAGKRLLKPGDFISFKKF